ncbi:MAG: hypothetical protein AAGU05_01125 [Anaerolineaceae bacterium]
MFDKIKQQLKEYEDAAAEHQRLADEHQRMHLLNLGAAEALRRLLEPTEGEQGTAPSSSFPAPESEVPSES